MRLNVLVNLLGALVKSSQTYTNVYQNVQIVVKQKIWDFLEPIKRQLYGFLKYNVHVIRYKCLLTLVAMRQIKMLALSLNCSF